MDSKAEEYGLDQTLYLSYAIEDISIAMELAVLLKVAGLPVWVDRLDCRPHGDYFRTIEETLEDCKALIMLVSSRSLTSSYCLAEYSLAQDRGIRIIPILLEDVEINVYLPDLKTPPYNAFASKKSFLLSKYVGSLVEFIQQQLDLQLESAIENERAYLYRLLGQLESSKSLTHALVTGLEPERTNSGLAIRPSSRLIDTWNGKPHFTTLGTVDDFEGGKQPVYAKAQDILLHHKRFQLIGPGGSGKTSFLVQAAIDMAHARLENRQTALLPIYLNFSNWDGEQDEVAYFKQQWSLNSPAVSLLNDNQTCVLVDVPSPKFDASVQTRLASWIDTQLDVSRVIVATQKPLPVSSLVTIKINLLEADQIRQFLHRYCDDLGDELGSRLIDSDDLLTKYVRKPFWLAVSAFVLKNGLMEPETSVNLGRLLRVFLEGVYRQHTNREALHLPWIVLEQALARLAFGMLDQNLRNRVSIEFAYELGVTEGALRAAQQAGILIYDRKDQIGFRFKPYMEYFAAEGLRLEGLPTRLFRPEISVRGRLVATKWTPVTIMLAGFSDDPSTTVESISEVNPFLALQCVASGITIESFAMIQVVHRLIGFIANEVERWMPAVRQIARLLPTDLLRTVLLQEARSSGWQYREVALAVARDLDSTEVSGLQQALQNFAGQTSGAVSTVVGKFGERAIPALTKLLADEAWEVRLGSAQVLGDLRDKAATPALVYGLSDANYSVAAACANALGEIGDPHSARWLVGALKHQDWRVRKAASKSLSILGRSSISELTSALNDSDEDVRIHAVQALGEINDKSVIGPLLRASYDQDVEVRSAAINALGKVEDMDAINRIIESLSDVSMLRSSKERVRDLSARLLRQLGFVDKADAYNVNGEPIPQATTVESAPVKAASVGSAAPAVSTPTPAEQGKERLRRITRANQGEKPLSADFLKDPDWRVRQAGVNAIPVGSDEAVTVAILKKALQDEDNQVRVAAVRKLGTLNTEHAVGGLLYALRDNDYLVADTAAEILQSIGKKAIPGLLKLLKSKNVNMRGAAVESLGKIADPIAVDALIECLDDTARPWLSNERICDLAADALFAINTPAAIAAVQRWRQQELQSHAAANHVEFATQSSGLAEDLAVDNRDRILTQLLDSLDSGDWESRVDAAKALREYTRGMKGEASDTIRRKLQDKLLDEDWSVRWAVAEALSWIGNEETVTKLSPLLKDDYWMVRIAVVRALMEIKSETAIQSLSNAIQDESEVVREAIAEALGEIGTVASLSALRVLATKDENDLVRLAAVTALTKINHSDVLSLLSRATKDQFDPIRWEATRGLVGQSHEQLVPVLVARLEDTYKPHMEQKRVCDFAIEGLQNIDSQQAQLAIENWQRASTGSS